MDRILRLQRGRKSKNKSRREKKKKKKRYIFWRPSKNRSYLKLKNVSLHSYSHLRCIFVKQRPAVFDAGELSSEESDESDEDEAAVNAEAGGKTPVSGAPSSGDGASLSVPSVSKLT